MHATLAGKPPYPTAQPAGVSQSQGDWMFDEFLNTGGVRTLDLDVPQRLNELVSP